MTICTECGRDNEARFYFCGGCGANLKAQRADLGTDPGSETLVGSVAACRSCGADVPIGHVFCGRCGERQHPRTQASEVVPEAPERLPTAHRARLVVVNPDGSSGERIPLPSGETVLGRGQGPAPVRDDPYLSPRHAAFRWDEGRLSVRDLDSLNGIFSRIAEPTELCHRDRFRVGRQLLRLEMLEQLSSLVPPDGSEARALGAPRGDAWGRLVRISSPGRSSQAFLLIAAEEVIGRERGTVLFRDDGFVSGRHARLTTSGGGVVLEDLRSSNGTFVRVRGSRALAHGDLLLMGQVPLRVVLE